MSQKTIKIKKMRNLVARHLIRRVEIVLLDRK